MPDKIILKKDKDSAQYAPHPEGQTVVLCVDTVDLGMCVGEWQAKVKVQHKIALIFQSAEQNPETGEHYLLTREFTVSAFAKANLRQFLESWRGKPYSDEQLEEEGLPIHKLVGVAGLANIVHKESAAGRTYANIQSLVPVPKGLAVPTLPAYERPKFLEERKAKYLEEYTVYRKANAPVVTAKVAGGGPGMERDVPPPEFDGFPDALDDDDTGDLPF